MIAVIVVCYKRIAGIRRLYESLRTAEYGNDRVTLIFSVDHSEAQSEIVAELEQYPWDAGEKRIRAFSERQGLRSHILQCGDLTNEFDAVIVLEDDLIVSPGFYAYAKQAVTFYQEDDCIKGISLYSHSINPGCSRLFTPAHNRYDAFFMQFAQSWGQCWTKQMWVGFRAWYDAQTEHLSADGVIPDYVAHWNDSSWLKYYIKYTAQTGGYYVYPYVSLTSNNSDIGEHNVTASNDYQVPLLEGTMDYSFPRECDAVKYDAFFERILPQERILPELKGKKLLDLYGLRREFGDADILISTQRLPYRILKSICLKYRPQEQNCIFSEDGNDIFVYDLHTSARQNLVDNRYNLIRYDMRAINWRKTLLHARRGFIQGLAHKLIKR